MDDKKRPAGKQGVSKFMREEVLGGFASDGEIHLFFIFRLYFHHFFHCINWSSSLWRYWLNGILLFL